MNIDEFNARTSHLSQSGRASVKRTVEQAQTDPGAIEDMLVELRTQREQSHRGSKEYDLAHAKLLELQRVKIEVNGADTNISTDIGGMDDSQHGVGDHGALDDKIERDDHLHRMKEQEDAQKAAADKDKLPGKDDPNRKPEMGEEL